MGAEVGFDGLRPVVQIVDPRVVTLFLGGYGVLALRCPCAQQDFLDPFQPRFDSAQAAVDGVILSRHLWRGGCCRDCCEGRSG